MSSNPSLLIVDDSLAICKYLQAVFDEFGINKVEACQDGLTALNLVERNPAEFDAIFIDLHMDGMDGLELISRLHDIRYRGGVVIISALDKRILDFAFEIVSNFNLRIIGLIEKPIENSVLAFILKRIKNLRPVELEDPRYIKRRELFEAIKNNQVLTWFQPKISSRDNSVMGLECLCRLSSIDQTIILPGRFIPVAEKFGLIEALMESILDTVLPQYIEFVEKSGIQPTLSINVSPLQLRNDMLPEMITEYLNKYGIDRDNLLLEITENHAIREKVQLKNLNRLRIHGYKLSLDDYGAGFTNLRQLKNMPFNEIKLDAALIDGIARDKVLQVIVESIEKVSHKLDIQLIAEGIFDPIDLEVLQNIGVDGFQGFIFCRPKPLEELLRWYRVWKANINVEAPSNEFRFSIENKKIKNINFKNH